MSLDSQNLDSEIKISACILVKNAQSTILQCLNSLAQFDEIILLDNGSTDDTLKIATQFNENFQNLKVFQSEFIGFGALKNLAISHASHDWIFSIDSDEVLESGAYNEMKKIISQSSNAQNIIASLPRKNMYRGEWIKACGWWPDNVIRLFNRRFTKFNTALVHESVQMPKGAQKITLKSSILHYSFNDISHLLDKLQRYSSLWAKQNLHKSSSPLKASLRSFWSFLRNYFFKKGVVYGYRGFIISSCNALGVFFKYMKLYELQLVSPSVSLIITTYNQKERLAKVLDSVKNLKLAPDEVLIADDGSRSDTADLIKQYQPKIQNLRHIWQEDLGFRLSEIRNLAIESATSQYIIIVDGDMILEPNFVLDHLRFARHGVFVQGSRVILNAEQTAEAMTDSDFKLPKSLKATRCWAMSKPIYKTSKIDKKFFDKKDFIKGVRGCNMAFFKADCVAINGFNADFEGWGREDSEFVARFLFNGGEFRRLKFSAIAYHLYHPESTRKELEKNHNIYLQTIKERAKFCKNGIVKA